MADERLTYRNIRDTGKTLMWSVFSGEVLLGEIKWHAPWRRYCFYPHNFTLFDRSCLAELIAFIDAQMQTRKSGAA